MKVSIIIPVYNVSAYIERCIKSVINQTYKDIECIIVDDASPDDSIVKCEKMIAEYDGPIKFTILHHKQNRGLSGARNTGTKASSGEYLFYLDSDDEITPSGIEVLLKPMIEDSTIEIVQGNHIEEKNGKEIKYNKGKYPIVITQNNDVYEHYYRYHHIAAAAWSKLIRRSFLIDYQLFFREGLLFEDRFWIFYVIKHLKKMIISKDIAYVYHLRPHSITTSKKNRMVGESNHTIYNEFLQNLTYGHEHTELSGLVYAFCRFYCEYYDEVPELKDTYKLYLQQAKRYNCWYAYSLLTIVGFVRKIGNPIGIMKKFHIIRWRLMELPDIIFNRH